MFLFVFILLIKTKLFYPISNFYLNILNINSYRIKKLEIKQTYFVLFMKLKCFKTLFAQFLGKLMLEMEVNNVFYMLLLIGRGIQVFILIN